MVTAAVRECFLHLSPHSTAKRELGQLTQSPPLILPVNDLMSSHLHPRGIRLPPQIFGVAMGPDGRATHRQRRSLCPDIRNAKDSPYSYRPPLLYGTEGLPRGSRV